jgi:hypothetical protein
MNPLAVRLVSSVRALILISSALCFTRDELTNKPLSNDLIKGRQRSICQITRHSIDPMHICNRACALHRCSPQWPVMVD